jgi:hypothetical protein
MSMRGLDRLTNRLLRLAWSAAFLMLGVSLVGLTGCYDPRRGNPVDRYHYEHTIFVLDDYSHARVQTFLARSHLEVGMKREDFYDGDRDGKLATPGMDRVQITEYRYVEDPPEKADRRDGDIAEYDTLFQEIIAAAKAKKTTFRIDSTEFKMELASEDFSLALSPRVG